MNVRRPKDHVIPRTGSNMADLLSHAFTCRARVMFSLNFVALLMRYSKKINRTGIDLKGGKRSNISIAFITSEGIF